MATKKNTAKKKKAEKTVMIKIAEKVGELAARVVNEKEHLVALAGNAVKSVKATIQKATSEKNLPKKASTPVRKKAAKKIAGPVAKKAGKAVKKAAPAKKGTKKKSAEKR